MSRSRDQIAIPTRRFGASPAHGRMTTRNEIILHNGPSAAVARVSDKRKLWVAIDSSGHTPALAGRRLFVFYFFWYLMDRSR